MQIAKFIYDLIDTLTHGQDYTVKYDVEIQSETPTTVTADWEAIIIMRVDDGTLESALLPGIPIPGNPHKEQRRIFIEWASEDDKKSLNGNYGFKWLKDNEIIISWDDEAISEDELKYYLDYGVSALGGVGTLEECELGDYLYEYFGSFNEIDWGEYPNRLHPYMASWIESSSYKE